MRVPSEGVRCKMSDNDDEYYDADEWSEGQILVGSLKIWNLGK